MYASSFVAEFDAVKRFRYDLRHDALPTIDEEVVLYLVFNIFEKRGWGKELEDLAVRLISDGWMIENEAWEDWEEELSIKNHLYHSIKCLGFNLHREMSEFGLFPIGTETYTYKRMLDDNTIIFDRTS